MNKMTQEEKEAFFVLHWGQNVAVIDSQKGDLQRVEVSSTTYRHLGLPTIECIKYLELKSFPDRMTDQDYIDMARASARAARMSKAEIKLLAELIKQYPEMHTFTTRETDFLRSRGFLTRFRQYTPEQILELGLAKIKPDV